jgi:hypothetical protein
MVINMDESRLFTIEQLEAFLGASEQVTGQNLQVITLQLLL